MDFPLLLRYGLGIHVMPVEKFKPRLRSMQDAVPAHFPREAIYLMFSPSSRCLERPLLTSIFRQLFLAIDETMGEEEPAEAPRSEPILDPTPFPFFHRVQSFCLPSPALHGPPSAHFIPNFSFLTFFCSVRYNVSDLFFLGS